MIWGVVFGVLFVRFYDKVPGKGILKGLTFSIIVFFFTTFQTGIYGLVYLVYGSFDWGIACIIAGVFALFPFGLVIGLLYRTPAEASSVKKEEIQTVKMVKCIHCNTSIQKGSEYCNKCGKKQ